MNTKKLPPGQHETDHLLQWNVEHPGIISKNPRTDLKTWTLTIDGEVKNPQKLTWRQLLRLPTAESTSDFHCVEGWSVTNLRWHGIKFSTIIQLAQPNKNAVHVTFTCADGYTTSLTLQELLRDDVILATKLDDRPLETPLGGPLRLVIPQKYAYKSAMWIERITFTKTRELGFWEKRGYSDTADVWKNDRFATY
jgi:DMSO/TMAO reductase YedYZ molybdopterin-dependent catalytic subunit